MMRSVSPNSAWYADDQQDPRVLGAGGSPFGGEPSEVLDVEGDHDAALGRGELEQALVLPSVEIAFLVGGADVGMVLA
jgi:hypothetical protein